MKKLFLIRHAKSDWSIPGIDDIDRPLNQRGYGDAHRMGRHLRNSELRSAIILTSPAIRALSTALIIAREIEFPSDHLIIEHGLYHAEVPDYLNLIQSVEDKFEIAAVFGHNPVISEVITRLSGKDEGEVPTCAVYLLRFEINQWNQAGKGNAVIEQILSPRQLSEQSH